MTTATMTTLTAANIEQIRYLEAKPVNWIEKHCMINPKPGQTLGAQPGQLVHLTSNVAQHRVLAVVEMQENAGLPVRIIILKARQEGVTSIGVALQYQWANTIANQNCLMSAHDHEASLGIFRKYKIMQENDPAARPFKYSNREEITYAVPHGSVMQVKTAGSESLGRGDTLHRFHGSEVAFWPHASETLLSVLQIIPDAPGTAVILESTANGVGGEFNDRWDAAVRGQGSYYPLFLPWWTFPEYTVKVA